MDHKTVKELTLLLLYATSWQEGKEPLNYIKAWKGYPFKALDELTDQGYIFGSKKSKSVGLTEEGIKKAEELKVKYLSDP